MNNKNNLELKLIEILNEELRKKIDENLLYLIDLFFNESKKDLVVYDELNKILKKDKFPDEYFVFRDLLAEIAITYNNLELQKKERVCREIKVQNYLAKNLCLLEEGLKLIKENQIIKGGEADIYAEDKNGNPVIIEVKAAYDSGLVNQIKKYIIANTEENPNTRFMIVAPKINTDVFYGFNEEERKRIKFYEINLENNTIKEIHKQDIEKKNKIREKIINNAQNNTREKKNENIVHLKQKARPAQAVFTEKIENNNKINNENHNNENNIVSLSPKESLEEILRKKSNLKKIKSNLEEISNDLERLKDYYNEIIKKINMFNEILKKIDILKVLKKINILKGEIEETKDNLKNLDENVLLEQKIVEDSYEELLNFFDLNYFDAVKEMLTEHKNNLLDQIKVIEKKLLIKKKEVISLTRITNGVIKKKVKNLSIGPVPELKSLIETQVIKLEYIDFLLVYLEKRHYVSRLLSEYLGREVATEFLPPKYLKETFEKNIRERNFFEASKDFIKMIENDRNLVQNYINGIKSEIMELKKKKTLENKNKENIKDEYKKIEIKKIEINNIKSTTDFEKRNNQLENNNKSIESNKQNKEIKEREKILNNYLINLKFLNENQIKRIKYFVNEDVRDLKNGKLEVLLKNIFTEELKHKLYEKETRLNDTMFYAFFDDIFLYVKRESKIPTKEEIVMKYEYAYKEQKQNL